MTVGHLTYSARNNIPPNTFVGGGIVLYPNNIRAIREKRNIKQPRFAEIIKEKYGVGSQSMIDRLEKGQRPLTDEWMKRLAPHLGVEPYQLIQEDLDIENLGLRVIENASSIPESRQAASSFLPLYATVRREVGKVDFSSGPSGEVVRPDYLKNVKGAFSILIVEKTVHKFDVNDIAMVDPRPVPVPGNIVAVLHSKGSLSGAIDVLKLVSKTDTKWTFLRESPEEKRVSFSIDEVQDVFKVRGSEFAN